MNGHHTRACPLCNDTGWRIIAGDNREYAQKCECQAVDTFIKRCKIANIPPRFIGFELKTYFPQDNNSSQIKAQKLIRDFIDQYPAVKDNKGLLFQGPTGVGKTRLLCSLANELIKKFDTIDIYYIDWNDLVREMKSGESHATRDFVTINELNARLISTELLIFDELGASTSSEWVSDNLYHIFNKRYNNQKLTVCASNYPDTAVNQQETLAQRIGARIRSRLYEMTEAFEIKGADFRRSL